jgi:ATP-dependent helicase YprA (DUF1998 family)
MTANYLDAIAAAERISTHYARYLNTTFEVGDPELGDHVRRALEQAAGLTKGPFLQVVPPFTAGVSLQQLIADGLMHRHLAMLSADALPLARPLYAHQERALRLAVGNHRNLLVATGTGSGKTETFLLPIIDHLLREREARTLGPGVRALLLYPMNVLANDQMRRIRALLQPYPEVTFGRYIGATEQTNAEARKLFRMHSRGEPVLANELMSREEMQATPPNILVTNFSMLEYLLLRTADLKLFATNPTTWRFIVLDEVHTYSGAKGTEIASLIRRVKQRVLPPDKQRGSLQCMGTSATLGGERDNAELVRFASDLFGESFEWDVRAVHRQDVVTPERDSGHLGTPTIELSEKSYGEILARLDAGGTEHELATFLEKIAGIGVPSSQPRSAQVAAILSADKRFVEMRAHMVQEEVAEPDVLATKFFPTLGTPGLIALIALGTRARFNPADAALLPARFHFLVRSLDGVYGCLHPRHPKERERVLLDPHLLCPACQEDDLAVHLFEIAACQACGSAYLAGVSVPDHGKAYLRATTPSNPAREWYLLDADAITQTDEDEEEIGEGAGPARLLPTEDERWLCVGCGAIDDAPGECGCEARAVRRVLLVVGNEEGVVTQCVSCRRRNPAGIVRRLAAGADGPLSVVASDLYQSLPPVLSGEHFVPGEGRKLISFADSRQQAAQFAVFLDRTYGRSIQRNLIVRALDGFRETNGTGLVSLAELRASVARRAVKEGVSASGNLHEAERIASTWIIREAITGNQRLSLEGTGLLSVTIRIPRPTLLQPLVGRGFSPAEALDFVQELLATMRYSGGVSIPDGIGAGDIDIPGTLVSFRSEGSKNGVKAWLPSGNRKNSRSDYAHRVLSRMNSADDPAELLSGLWTILTDVAVPVLSVEQSKRDGVTCRIHHNALEFAGSGQSGTWRCDRCRRLTHRSVRGACPTYGCRGTLKEVDKTASEGHYAQLYRELAPIPAKVEEHTAQIQAHEATKIQNGFQDGLINILSCSTTFELGVDVGEIQAVLMRNVPPSAANYVQRAGRAGRRADSTALVVTFAQRRNHDRFHFENPLPMLRGVVQPPVMTLKNLTILRRHVQSVAFAMFEHLFDRRDANVVEFFGDTTGSGPAESAYALFRRWLESEPAELLDALTTLLTDMPHQAELLGIENWAWVDRLLSVDTEQLDRGWLTRAHDEFAEMDGRLDELVEAARVEKAWTRGKHLERLQTTIRKRDLLGYLAAHAVLPKYGFPSDVVEMRIQTEESAGTADAGRIQLSRDLQVAVAEYAPGAQVVAGKQVWESIGLATRRDRALLRFHWLACRECETYAESQEELHDLTACPNCGAKVPGGQRGMFVIPTFGFVGKHVSAHSESPPLRAGAAEFHFARYQGNQPEPKTVALGNGAAPMDVMSSPSGRIAVLNRGRRGRGFQICAQCGFATAPTKGRRNAKGHPVPGRTGITCNGMLSNMALGHRFVTDVLEIRPNVPMSRPAALSVLYALVTGAVVLGIPDNDIGGVLRPLGSGRFGLVLYDTVPGGAGHVTSLAGRLGDLFDAALQRVHGCTCGAETSCYGCLRNYRNERVHDDLNRREAIDFLHAMMGTPATTTT